MTPTWTHVLSALSFVACCVSLPAGKAAESKTPLFEHDLSSLDGLQSWQDWLAKRGFEGQHWDFNDLSHQGYQNWQDLFKKRGFGFQGSLGNFEPFDNSKFQEWKEWVSKRQPFLDNPSSMFHDFDKSQLQQWNDWVSKRNFDTRFDAFEHGPSSLTGLQNWADFSKRQGFISPSTSFGFSNSGHFQDWQDWVKRMGSARNGELGTKDRFIKRQLGFNPDRYGFFNNYFTDGLQDWRSSFRSSKRNKQEKPNSQQ